MRKITEIAGVLSAMSAGASMLCLSTLWTVPAIVFGILCAALAATAIGAEIAGRKKRVPEVPETQGEVDRLEELLQQLSECFTDGTQRPLNDRDDQALDRAVEISMTPSTEIFERIERFRKETGRKPHPDPEMVKRKIAEFMGFPPISRSSESDPSFVPPLSVKGPLDDKLKREITEIFPEYVRKGKKESPTSSAEVIAEILRGLVTEHPESRAEIEELIRRTETQPTKHEEENPFDHSPYCSGDALPSPKNHLFRRATEALPSESLRRQARRLRKKAETINDPEKKRLTLSEADECEQRARHQDSCPPFPREPGNDEALSPDTAKKEERA